MIKARTRTARRLRREETHAERLLWAALRGGALGVKFRRQHPIGRYVADFACVERKLIVEVDGPVHERVAEVAARDVERAAELEAAGWMVVRVTNEAVVGDLSGVLAVIEAELQRLDP